MRKKIVAGNWKMNLDRDESVSLIQEINNKLQHCSNINGDVMVAPPFINIAAVFDSSNTIQVISQNMHQEEKGAFTGEVSAKMLLNIGISTTIIGHSERRAYFNETDEILKQKVNTALVNGMQTIFCFGEKLEDRNSDNHFNIVENQIKNALFHLNENDWLGDNFGSNNIILAYEPVWAIGTGMTATPEQAQEMHAFIRNLIENKYNSSVSENISILYGGSVKPANAKEIFGKPDVDGGLIGGAALKAEDFVEIIKAM